MKINEFTCPSCGETFIRCQAPEGCDNWAEYEGWYGRGLMRIIFVCEKHISITRAGQAGKTKEDAIDE